MDKSLRLVVLEKDDRPPDPKSETRISDPRLETRMNRSKAMNAISASGGRVVHDSGGRFLLVEAPKEAVRDLASRLSSAQVVAVDADVTKKLTDLDASEALFLDALKLRTSKSYREAKARRVFGETPQEQELIKGSCVREEY